MENQLAKNQTITGGSQKQAVSIVIPSYNSKRTIRNCLQALDAQVTQLQFEIIMVDSSNDGTDQIVALEFPNVKLHHYKDRVFVGTARNIGVQKARGDIVLFLDTDCIVRSDWIDRMCQALHDLGADGIGGSVKNGTPRSISGSVGFYLEFFRFLAYNGKPCYTYFLLGANSGYMREVFHNAHYNDSYSETLSGEDFIFNWQVSKQGKILQFVPTISVTHLNKKGIITVLRYQHQLGKGACSYRNFISPKIMRLFIKFPVLTFFLPTGMMPWIGAFILRRRGILEFFKFVALLPLLLISNGVWTAGFYQELLAHKAKLWADEKGSLRN